MEAVLTTGRPSSPAGELRKMNGARHREFTDGERSSGSAAATVAPSKSSTGGTRGRCSGLHCAASVTEAAPRMPSRKPSRLSGDRLAATTRDVEQGRPGSTRSHATRSSTAPAAGRTRLPRHPRWRPLEMHVSGLEPNAHGRDWYELWLTKGGKAIASCGRFTVAGGRTTVQLSVPTGCVRTTAGSSRGAARTRRC